MKGYKLGVLAFLVVVLLLAYCNKEKPVQRTDNVHNLKQKVDTLIIKVTEVQDRVIPSKRIYLHDTTVVFQQLLTRDTVIQIQDSIIRIQDTIIKQVEYVDSLKSDTIQAIKAEVKRERFWKRIFRGMVPAAFVIGKAL